MTETDHRILTDALTEYELTGDPTTEVRLTPQNKASIFSLRLHKYLRTTKPIQPGDRYSTITLTLKGINASRNLPADPTGPLPTNPHASRDRKNTLLDDRVLLVMLESPTIPHDSADLEEALDSEVGAIALSSSLRRLRERGAIELAIAVPKDQREGDMYVPTLQTVQNYLHITYPNRKDYEAAKARVLGRAFTLDMLDDEPLTDAEAHELDKTFTRDARAAMLQLWTAYEQGVEAIPTSVEADHEALEVLKSHKLAAPTGDGLWRITLGGLTYARNRWGKHQKAA